jgi:hypothetical protein
MFEGVAVSQQGRHKGRGLRHPLPVTGNQETSESRVYWQGCEGSAQVSQGFLVRGSQAIEQLPSIREGFWLGRFEPGELGGVWFSERKQLQDGSRQVEPPHFRLYARP